MSTAMQDTRASAPERGPRFQDQPQFDVKRPMWRKDDEHAHLSGPAVATAIEGVLKRDNYKCRYCGFKASKHQEVHHLDGDHGNQAATNLVTVCTLCHQVHHLGMSGMRNTGFIAPLPELTQTEVNHITRAHFVAQLLADQNTKDRLTGLYALMQARSDALKQAYNYDIGSPLLLAEALATCSDELYAGRAAALRGLRLVPTAEAFRSGQLEYYAANLKTPFDPQTWSALAGQLAQ